MCQGARLVEHDGIDLRQHIEIVGTLDQDALTRSTANATEERQRHADDQGTRATDDEEHQGAIEPSREVNSE